MTPRLLDASAVLAAIYDEAGAEEVRAALEEGAIMSTVSVAEVAARLREDRWTAGEVADVVTELGIEVVPFDAQTALQSGAYRPETRRMGAGLGGRACLATARRLRVPVLTADRRWAALKLRGVEVICVG